jgi:outer membrane protein
MCLTNGHKSKISLPVRTRRTGISAAGRVQRLLLVLGLSLTVTAHSDAANDADPLAVYLSDALASNALLKAQDFAVEAAAQGLGAARAQRAPQLALTARYTVADGGRVIRIPTGDLVNPVYQTLNQLTAGSGNPTQFPQIGNNDINLLRRTEQDTRLTLSAPIYAPQIAEQIRIRAAEFDGSVATREAFARTLVRDVKTAYFQLAQIQAGIRILDASQITLAENRRVAEALVAAGKATRDRVLRAEAEFLAIEQRLHAARNDERAARRYLNLLRNRDEAAAVTVADGALFATPDDRGSQATRPELRGLDSRIDAADHATKLAGSSLLPTLSLVADSGIQGTGYKINRDADVSTASLVLNWTLFDFGARRAAESQARAQTQQLRETRDEVRRQLDLARLSADDNALTAERSLLTAEARIAAAEEGFRIAERKRDAGQLSQIEFLDAERAQTEARLGLAIARSDLQSARAEQEYTRAAYPLPATLVSSATP